MRRTAPCKNCLDREPHCHSNCSRYLDWKKEIDEQNAIRDKEQAAIPSLCREVVRQIYREMKRK